MLLAREKKIVTLLIEHEDKLTTTQIATSLKVSSRTIKADIKKINEELEKHSCRINSQQGVGLWIEYDNHEAKKYLKEVTRDTADLYLSPEVRKYHLAVELLLQDDYTSMEVLAKEYYISKATVLNDLNELDELWEHYGVHFIKKVKYGIKVEGNESQIRSALLEALKRAGGRQKVTVSNIQSHFTSVELKDLREIIGQMEGRFQFILTDISVGELMLDLAVMLERLSAGKTMDHEGSIPGRESRRMDFVLGYLKEHLTESFGIEIPDTEDCYLRICLSGLRFHVPMEKEQSLKEKRERNPEMFDYMMDLLMECDRKFYLQLEEDDELINALMDHLECMVLRLHSKMYTYNPILDAIKKELFYEYEIASFFMSKFTVKYGFNPTEDEIGFITSGIYVLNVKNQSGKVVLKKHGDYKQYYTEKGKKGQADKQHEYLFKNPMDESRFFAKRIEQRIGATKIPVRSVIIFPEHAEITWDGTPENEIPVIHRKQLIQTLKKENEKNERVLSDDQIDELYHLLADESIELEKNS